MDRWAVFDVDGTLLPYTSMEKLFLRHILSRRLLPPGNIVTFLLRGVMGTIKYGFEDGLKSNKFYLKGLSSDKIENIAETFFNEHVVSALSVQGIRRLEQLKTGEYRIMIASGSPSFLAGRLDKVLHPDKILSTVMERYGGKYTGRIAGAHLYGERKRVALELAGSELGIDFDRSVVYANHHTDIPHMELFGNAVAVNPTKKLIREAARRKWEIVYWT